MTIANDDKFLELKEFEDVYSDDDGDDSDDDGNSSDSMEECKRSVPKIHTAATSTDKKRSNYEKMHTVLDYCYTTTALQPCVSTGIRSSDHNRLSLNQMSTRFTKLLTSTRVLLLLLSLL